MTNHPITPPPELVDKLFMLDTSEEGRLIAAYRVGADQELEACCLWMERNYNYPQVDHPLRTARRPKPPSLKEQALADLDSMSIEPCLINGIDANALVRAKYDNIRRALESLDD